MAVVKQTLNRIDWARLLFVGLALGTGAIASLLVIAIPNPVHLFIIIAGATAVLAMTISVEFGLLILVFTTYTRFSDIMIEFHGAPSVAKLLVPLLFLIVFARWIVYGDRPVGWRRAALVVVGYGLVGFVSLLYARNFAATQEELIRYAKDAIIVVLVVMLLQRAATLRRVAWALLAVAIFTGSLSVYQYLTGTFDNNYWGFAQANVFNIIGETNDYRISGPTAGPNEYAQMLLLLVPLALDRLWHERSHLLRFLAGWALAVSVLSIIFTFSRGGALGLVVLLAVMLVRRPPRPAVLLVTLVLLVPLLQLVPPEYTDRMRTLTNLLPGSRQQVETEVSFRGRLSENMSAWQMFREHPFIGVGLHNYSTHYQDYSRRLGLDPRRESRAAHNMYLQIAAEQGLVGLAAFGGLLWVVFGSLYQARQDFIRAGLHDYANITFALAMAVLGFLLAGAFLHLIHPRFWWLLVGIAMASPHIARRALIERKGAVYAG